MPIDKIRKAAIDAHIPPIEEAGQDAYWYDIAEAVPGPTTELMAQYAKTYQMAMVAPEPTMRSGRAINSTSSFRRASSISFGGSQAKSELRR